jgi:hypothetical protein
LACESPLGIDNVDMSRGYAAVAVLKDDLICRYCGRALLDPGRAADGIGIVSCVMNQGVAFDRNWQLFSCALRAQSVDLSLEKLLLRRHFWLSGRRSGINVARTNDRANHQHND